MKFPKPIRGQEYPGYTKINITQLEKWIKAGNKFTGFFVGNKVSSNHFFKGWCLACACDDESSWENMFTRINSFLFYLEPELGNNVAIYISNECKTKTK